MARSRWVSRRSISSVAVVVAVAALVAPHTPAEAVIATSGNLLTGNNAGFDTDTGGWSAVGASTIGTSTTVYDSGTGSMQVTATTGQGLVGGESPALPAVPGAHYTATAMVDAATTARLAFIVVAFYGATGSLVSGTTEWGQPRRDVVGTWTQAMPVVGIAPATAASVREFVLFSGVAAGESHYVDNASLTASTGTPAPLLAPLSTRGNHIVDASGSTVVLRGIHREGTQKSSYTPVTQTELQQAQNWGANVVRVPLAENRWIAGDCSYDPSYAPMIDQIVSGITSRGMLAILDLHYNAILPCGTMAQQPMADSKAITFWKQVASHYKANPLVAFDLYNEPHDISDSVWRNGGLVLWQNVLYQAAGMQQMYNAVRGTGASNLVIATGNGWGNYWPSTAPLSGYNIVYAAHAYTCPNGTPAQGGTCSTSNPYDPSSILDHFVTPGQSYPIVVTEFGWPDRNDGIYNRNVISYAETHGWGWIVFAWDGTTTGAFDLLQDVGATYEPAPAGDPVLIGLSRN